MIEMKTIINNMSTKSTKNGKQAVLNKVMFTNVGITQRMNLYMAKSLWFYFVSFVDKRIFSE